VVAVSLAINFALSVCLATFVFALVWRQHEATRRKVTEHDSDLSAKLADLGRRLDELAAQVERLPEVMAAYGEERATSAELAAIRAARSANGPPAAAPRLRAIQRGE
jgi:hypothetical protein